MSGKVFGIGLSKTGTTSLHHALTQLGFKGKHYPQHFELFECDFSPLDAYDAVTDIPAAAYYSQLDEVYPGSKFVLTVRDIDDWLASMERWLAPGRRPNAFMLQMRLVVYGAVKFDRSRFKYVYERHFEEVTHYFRGRSDDLLVMNICAGDGWEKLCAFLDKPTPKRDFPFIVPGQR
jgi:Sulfotransferase domain